ARTVDQLHLLGAVELEGVEAELAVAADLLDQVGRTVAADPAVGLHPVTHAAAEKLVHRHAQGLALDVPQRLVDAGDRAHQHPAAAVEAAAVERLPQAVDPRRILADDVLAQLVHRSLDRPRAALDHRLAPSGGAFGGIDHRVPPTWRGVVGGEAGDLLTWWAIRAWRNGCAFRRVASGDWPGR